MKATDVPREEWGETREFTVWLKLILELDGGVVVPLVAGSKASGWPDRLLYHRRWHGLLELKKSTGKLSGRQAKNIKTLWRRRPGCVAVLRCGDCTGGQLGCTCEDWEGTVLFRWNDAETLTVGLAGLTQATDPVKEGTGSRDYTDTGWCPVCDPDGIQDRPVDA
jgi:hypothetical protein